MTGLGVVLFAIFALLSIGLHEFGHFSTAKAFGMKVDRFFIGFGPRLWSVRRGETEYGVAALPFGGYVRIAGMNPFEEIPPDERHRVFKAKKPWQRAVVLVAGSFTHFVLAFVIIAIILGAVGVDQPTTTIGAVEPRVGEAVSPAVAAGLQKDDRLESVDGVVVRDWDHAVALIHDRPGRTVTLGVARGSERLTLTARLADRHPQTGERVGFLGVGPEIVSETEPPLEAVAEAGRQIGIGARESLFAFGRIFSPDTLSRLFSAVTGEGERRPDDPTTIVGIGEVAGDLARRGDFAGLFFLVAGFNIFVGVANLLPLPPLDGGHLAVLGYEKLTRRDVDMRRLLPVSAAVIAVFATLFILLLYLDIVQPLRLGPG